MAITVTDYLDVISSWCFWSEPTWAELKRRYAGRVQFQWKIALMDPSGLPTSREQEQWFYRRSGTMMRSAFMLNTDWYDPSLPEWLAPNCVAEAARDFGVTDDRVRLALAHAALRQGKSVADWNVAGEIAADAAGLEAGKLLERAKLPATVRGAFGIPWDKQTLPQKRACYAAFNPADAEFKGANDTLADRSDRKQACSLARGRTSGCSAGASGGWTAGNAGQSERSLPARLIVSRQHRAFSHETAMRSAVSTASFTRGRASSIQAARRSSCRTSWASRRASSG